MKSLKLFTLAIAATSLLSLWGCGEDKEAQLEAEEQLGADEQTQIPGILPPASTARLPLSATLPPFYETYKPITPVPNNFRIVKRLDYDTPTSEKPAYGMEYTYDEKGNKVKEAFCSYSGDKTNIDAHWTYEYSDDNKLLKMTGYGGSDGTPIRGFCIVHTYNGDREVKEETFRDDNSLIDYTIYEYGENTILKRRFSPGTVSGIDEISTKYTYDDKGRIAFIEVYSVDPEKPKYKKWIYDDQGREIKTEYYNFDWKLMQYVTKSYENNSLKEQTLYDVNNQLSYNYKYLLDASGNAVEGTLNGGRPLFKRKYDGKLLVESINPTVEWDYYEMGMLRYEYEPCGVNQ